MDSDAPNHSSIACVFVAAVTFLLSRCLATIGRVHIQAHRLMGVFYEVRRFAGLRCHVIHANFRKDGFRRSKADVGVRIRRDTDRMGIV
jgi:hypothetical protein